MRTFTFLALLASCLTCNPATAEERLTAAGTAAPQIDPQEIEILEELVEARTTLHTTVLRLQEHGVRGGEADREAIARYHLAVAKARLAAAKGDPAQCLKEQQAAVAAADRWVQIAQIKFENGTADSLEQLIAAQTQRAEAKLELRRLTKSRGAPGRPR